MEHMKMETKNIANENFEKLVELFPNAVTETVNENGEIVRAIDKDVLMQEINCRVVEGKEERYQFTWPDKKKSVLLANAPSTNTLRPCIEESVNFDTTENLYIEGDNLEVLKLLKETYLHKINLIYIDPPYNTGNDFVYDDDFSVENEQYKTVSGDFDELGNRLSKNLDSNGRFHTDWLNMIYPRLRVSKDLLTEDGVIFISIDDSEQSNIKKIADEVFGPSNFICQFIWSAGRKNDSKHVSVSHEYILAYFKNFTYIKEHQIIWREKKGGLDDIYTIYDKLKKQYGNDYERIQKELKSWYKGLPNGHPAKDHEHYCRVDEKGIFFPDNISWPGGGGPKYNVNHPITGKSVKVPSRGWLTNEKTLHEWIAQGKVEFGPDENCVPTLKSYLKDREYSVPYSVFYKDGRASSKRLATLMGDKVFENPKDEEIIQRIIDFALIGKDQIVLDFFSGSGTTAHSVFLSNAERKLNRKFILVQIPEEIDPNKMTTERSKKVATNAVKLLDSISKPHKLTEIGKERIRRAGKKIIEDSGNKDIDIGFRVLKLDSSNMEDVYYTPQHTEQGMMKGLIDNVKQDRSPLDLLFQVMLEFGISLSSKIECKQIDGKEVYYVEGSFLIASFDKSVNDKVVTEIAKAKPQYACLRDIDSDATLTNFEQIFKALSPNTECKII